MRQLYAKLGIRSKVQASLVTPPATHRHFAPKADGWYDVDSSGNEKRILGILDVYPVGSIYMSVVNTNPGTLFGGTWAAWGAGKMPVGVDAGQTEFDTVEETGGAKTHTLSASQLPTHTHTINHDHAAFDTSGNDGSHVHSSNTAAGTGGSGTSQPRSNSTTLVSSGGTVLTTNSEHAHNINVPAYTGDSGGGPGVNAAINHLPPYITCYMWKRTA